MGGVYEKFGINGDTRGKENRLRIFLNQKSDLEVQKKRHLYLLETELSSIAEVGGTLPAYYTMLLSEVRNVGNKLMTQEPPGNRLERIEAALDRQVAVNADLRTSVTELRSTAEALLQHVTHQQNFERLVAELNADRQQAAENRQESILLG